MYLEVHKYYKYIVIHLSISTSTFKDFKKELNEEAGYKSAQNWPKFSRFPRAGEPSMEAGPKGKKKSRPIIFILTCPTKIYTKT